MRVAAALRTLRDPAGRSAARQVLLRAAARGPLGPVVAGAARLPGALGAQAAFSASHAELEAGHYDTARIAEVAARLLDLADRALDRGARGERAAAQLADLAVQLSFHPTLSSGPDASPLATDPAAVLGPYRAARTGRLLFETPDPPRSADRPAPARERPRRVLVISHDSWTFVERLRTDLERDGDIEVRTLDVSALDPALRPSHRAIVPMRLAATLHGTRRALPAPLADELAWADVALCEWGTYPLAWLSLSDLEQVDTELIARIHRFEAFTPYPMLADLAAIDRIRFVAPAVRDMVAELAPRLAQCPDVEVILNVHDLSAFAPAKDVDSPFTLVMIGWAPPVKDVLFALETVRRLRRVDPRYRLRLVGTPIPTEGGGRLAPWYAAVRARIEELGPGAEILGYRTDVPEILAGAGFVLSTSRHEGTHESVAEGAAAGCVPVVRDWPEAARWGGAGGVYPAPWLIADVDAAVDRVLAHADLATLSAAGERARSWVLSRRDPDAVAAAYRTLVGAPPHPTGTISRSPGTPET